MTLRIVPDIINGQTFVMINFQETARKGAEFMKRHGIGAVLVVRTDYSPKGILTERDITLRVVAAGLDPDKTYLEDIMTTAPEMVPPESKVRDVLERMHAGNFRHMPVYDGRMAYGIVSVRDIYTVMIQRLEGEKMKQRADAVMKTSILPQVTRGQQLVKLPPGSTVAEAVHLMERNRVGAILVIEDGKLKGILTERDVTFQIVAAGLPPETTTLAEVSVKALETVNLDDSCEKVLQHMKARNCRHLPVFDGDRLVGVVSMRDVNNFLQDHIEQGFGATPIRRVLDAAMGRLSGTSKRRKE